jgi:flagella basal body P-ring formation protein FlgA
MKRSIITFITIIIFISTSHALSLKLKNVAKINNEVIKVSDLVERYDGKDSDYALVKNIVIDRLPYEKRMLNIKSNDIHSKIVSQVKEIPLTVSKNLVAVRWEELQLSRERISRDATNFLRDLYSLSPEAEIDFQNMPRLAVPSENVTLSFEKNRFVANSNVVRIDGKVAHQGKTTQVFHLLVKISENRNVYQANRSIKKGEPICVSDFSVVSANVNPVGIITTLQSLETLQAGGHIANGFIAKGSILKSSDIVSAPLIRRNETVTVLVQGSNMRLSYDAISRADGWKGQRIMLQNPESKQNFHAVVYDRNKVIINLED